VSFITIAALATVSRQFLDDFADYYASVPREMCWAVIDAETNSVANADGTAPEMTGIPTPVDY
jgi:hypothetical protein